MSKLINKRKKADGSDRTGWAAWLKEYGGEQLFDAFLQNAQGAQSTCMYCHEPIFLDIVEGGGVPDWGTEMQGIDGLDYGCPDSPDTGEEGTGSHMPTRRNVKPGHVGSRKKATDLVSKETLDQALQEARAAAQKLDRNAPEHKTLEEMYNFISEVLAKTPQEIKQDGGQALTDYFDDTKMPQFAGKLRSAVEKINQIRGQAMAVHAALTKMDAKMKAQARDALGGIADSVGYSAKQEVLIAKHGYFYTHGYDERKFADAIIKKLNAVGLRANIVSTSNHWNAWPRDSWFECRFTVEPSPLAVNPAPAPVVPAVTPEPSGLEKLNSPENPNFVGEQPAAPVISSVKEAAPVEEEVRPETRFEGDLIKYDEDDLVSICNSKYGWAVAEQLKSILNNEPFEDQNPNALRYIMEFAQAKKELELATDIKNYLEASHGDINPSRDLMASTESKTADATPNAAPAAPAASPAPASVPVIAAGNDVAQALLNEMGADNGCSFVPCPQHKAELDAAVAATKAEGLKFTPNQISTLAYGEQTDQERLYKKFPSGSLLNKALNEIFDGCRKCKTASSHQASVPVIATEKVAMPFNYEQILKRNGYERDFGPNEDADVYYLGDSEQAALIYKDGNWEIFGGNGPNDVIAEGHGPEELESHFNLMAQDEFENRKGSMNKSASKKIAEEPIEEMPIVDDEEDITPIEDAPVEEAAAAAPTVGLDPASLGTKALGAAIKALAGVPEFMDDKSAVLWIEQLSSILKDRPVEQKAAKSNKAPKRCECGAKCMDGSDLCGACEKDYALANEKAASVNKNAVAPKGWEDTVKEMKKHKEIDNPWALAWSMKDKGYNPHRASYLISKNAEYFAKKFAGTSGGGGFTSNQETLDVDKGESEGASRVTEIAQAHKLRDDNTGVDRPETVLPIKLAAEMTPAKALKVCEDTQEELKKLYLDLKPVSKVNDVAAVRNAIEAVYSAATLFDDAGKAFNKMIMAEEAEEKAVEASKKETKNASFGGLTLAAAE